MAILSTALRCVWLFTFSVTLHAANPLFKKPSIEALNTLLKNLGYAHIAPELPVCLIDQLPLNTYPSGSVVNGFIQGEHSRLYQASFDTNHWSGKVSAFQFKEGFSHLLWQTSLDINNNQKIHTYNPQLNKGIIFAWDQMSAGQQQRLAGIDNDSLAKKRLKWLYGERGDAVAPLRLRKHRLGDIIHSNIVFKGRYQAHVYQQLSGAEGLHYGGFLKAKRASQEMLFVSANDGLLHALNADTGEELFSYIADASLGKITIISDRKYGCQGDDCLLHEYLADGLGNLGDAYFDEQWHSLLVNTLGIGGKAVYALDVSTPAEFSAKNVLWEISTTQSPDNNDLFTEHLGLSHQKVNIVRLQSGRWAAIFGNGYLSFGQQAVLFVVDIETGRLIRMLETHNGGLDLPNGLSATTAIDADDNGSVDTVYAGDLLGHLWAFDLSSSDSSEWSVKYGKAKHPEPLFRACIDKSCTQVQAITQAVEVGHHHRGGLMIYFGTGYSDAIARLLSKEQILLNTIYGVWDQGKVLSSKALLLKQSILAETQIDESTKLRVNSTYRVDYNQQRGWYLDLDSPADRATTLRESLYSQPVLANGVLTVTTVVEDVELCKWGRKSWLMRLNAEQGARLKSASFDTNGDQSFSAQDSIEYNDTSTMVSGLQIGTIASQGSAIPVLRVNSRKEVFYISDDEGSARAIEAASSYSVGRLSWRKLQ
ncbi:MAG: hypothetical protein KAH22_02700 [Thiotrichaceae bacterium]|nr:hypothetical protein [Thiotrichaceae bacterium]